MGYLLVIAATFGVMFVLDKGLTKLFRSRDQHRSGTAVRLKKHYGILSLALMALGLLGIVTYFTDKSLTLLLGGVLILPGGALLGLYYLTHGIFYDGESFLLASFRKKDRIYRFEQIREQKLYLVQGGNIIIELYLDDGTSVSLQSSMDGIYLFLDTAFAGWCLQKGIEPADCTFHDPSKSWWFPHEEETE